MRISKVKIGVSENVLGLAQGGGRRNLGAAGEEDGPSDDESCLSLSCHSEDDKFSSHDDVQEAVDQSVSGSSLSLALPDHVEPGSKQMQVAMLLPVLNDNMTSIYQAMLKNGFVVIHFALNNKGFLLPAARNRLWFLYVSLARLKLTFAAHSWFS